MASTLTRWQPFADLAELRHRFDQAFSDLATGHDLPAGIDPSSITARAHDGVLEVTVPVTERQEPAHIKITPTST